MSSTVGVQRGIQHCIPKVPPLAEGDSAVSLPVDAIAVCTSARGLQMGGCIAGRQHVAWVP